MIATPKFSRNYSTAFHSKAGIECEVPDEVFKKFPSHFVVRMKAVDTEKQKQMEYKKNNYKKAK